MRKLVLFFQLLVVNFVFAQKEYPIPPITENRLFYIQHDGNHNTYVYDAAFIKANLLNDLKPVTIYRIVYTEGGVKKKLTRIQETLAYGLGVFLNTPHKKIRTVVLVDRSHKIFPIATDFVGLQLATILKEHVDVVLDVE